MRRLKVDRNKIFLGLFNAQVRLAMHTELLLTSRRIWHRGSVRPSLWSRRTSVRIAQLAGLQQLGKLCDRDLILKASQSVLAGKTDYKSGKRSNKQYEALHLGPIARQGVFEDIVAEGYIEANCVNEQVRRSCRLRGGHGYGLEGELDG